MERSESLKDSKTSLNGPPSPSPHPEWASDSVLLKDFSTKRGVPAFAKVVKGSYMTLGNSKFSFQKQHQEVFIHSARVSVKVLAHCLRRVETHSVVRRGSQNLYATTRLYAIDQRLAIPISYQGWFELLSEDGKSARPYTSVHELARARPDKCLVRENIKAYLLNEDNKMTFDNTKIVIAGEQLLLNGEISLPTIVENKKVKLLRCIDLKGETVYLSFDQKGAFTPIAGEKDFTGVFAVRDIIRRFRLPLTVKLVMGVKPKVDPSKFTGLIRLDWVYTDETAFICPIEKNHVRLLPVPTGTPLQLVSAANQEAMKTTELYRNMMTKCSRMISNYNNTLHLIVQVPEVLAKGGRPSPNSNVFSTPFVSESSAPASVQSRIREEKLMNDIDNLYAYVRDGGAPPKVSKFAYDSDEESYWEEPAYEHLDDFRARLKAIEAGEKVSYPVEYQPQDPAKLALEIEPTPSKRSGDIASSTLNNARRSPRKISESSLPTQPPDLLVNASSTVPASSPSTPKPPSTTPPEPPATRPPSATFRRYSSEVTTVSNLGLVSSAQSAQNISYLPQTSKDVSSPTHKQQNARRTPIRTFSQSRSAGDVVLLDKHGRPLSSTHRRNSHESNSNSGSSSGNGHRNFAKDFRDSDISSVTKAGSSGSSGGKGPTQSNVRKKLQTLYL